MAFLLPSEFRAPADQEIYSDSDELEYEEMVAKLIVVQQAIFNRPVKHRYLKALYMKGLVDGKPMSKMLVDGGASINLMSYTTFHKLGKGPEDLLETDMMLRDFGGNTSKTRWAINVELTIGSKTLPTTFFVIDGKGSYSLLLGRDWIHANCCIPSTMHQCLIQCHRDDVKLVRADESTSIATADPVFWELGDFEYFSGKTWEGDFIKINNESQQSMQAIGSESVF